MGRVVPVDDRLGHRDQEARGFAHVFSIDQDGTVLQRGSVGINGQGKDGIEQGVTGGNEVGLGFACDVHVFTFERDSFVGVKHRCANATLAVAVPDGCGHVRDLVPACFARGDSTAQALEGGEEEGLDVVRLKAACLGVLEAVPDLVDVHLGQDLGVEGTFRDEPVKALSDCRVDDLVEARSDLGLVPVPDGFHEELA